MSSILLLTLPLLACQSDGQKAAAGPELTDVSEFVRAQGAPEADVRPARAPEPPVDILEESAALLDEAEEMIGESAPEPAGEEVAVEDLMVDPEAAELEPLATAAPIVEPEQDEGTPKPGFDHSHAVWDALLGAHVEGGLMDYRGLAKDRRQLDQYLAQLAAVTPEQSGEWAADERFAFYANAYNAHVAKLILDAYPLKSINDLSTDEERVWDQRFIPLGAHLEAGRELISLDELENAILRPRFKDPRVHVAVNCASIGCPPLDTQAIKAEGFDRQLDRLMRAFLGDGVRNQFDENERTVRLSQIFNWFRGDFEQDGSTLLAYLQRYGPAGDAAWLGNSAMEFLDYDWSLNDVPRKE